MEFWDQYGGNLTLLGLYAAGIAAFAIVVTLLYVPMGTRLMFAKRFGERAVATPGRRFLYVLFFPLVSFAFFLLVSAALFAFGLETSSTDGRDGLEATDILVVAMSTVLAIRITAYFTETGAQEVAKIMPLGLLGYFLVTNKVDRLGEVFENMLKFFDHLDLVGIFFGIVVVVEFLLRAVYELAGRPGGGKVKGTPPARGGGAPPVTFQRRT